MIRSLVAENEHRTFASRLMMTGVDLKTVQELMGHKTFAMTARHTHFAPTQKLQELGAMVHPGSVLVQSGRQSATDTKAGTYGTKPSDVQDTESLKAN